jgi:hypothetical protein
MRKARVSRAGLAFSVALVALFAPAWAQEQAPVSILPPAAKQEPAPKQEPPADASQEEAPQSLLPAGRFNPGPASSDEMLAADPGGEAAIVPLPLDPTLDETMEEPQPVGLTGTARAPLDLDNHGLVGPSTGGFGPNVWRGSRGRPLAALLAAYPSPAASKYTQILLRRVLTTRAAPPVGLGGADFAAERALLLLRLGDVERARALLEPIPVSRYSRRLYYAGGQTFLAAVDFPALCPLALNAVAVSRDPLWPLASAVCMALNGDDAGAAINLDYARDRSNTAEADLQLAERLVSGVTAGASTAPVQQSAWPQGAALTTFRLAAALGAGTPPPAALVARAPVQVQGWMVRAGALPVDQRFGPAHRAAALGLLTADELASHWAARQSAQANTLQGQLGVAYSAPTTAARLGAMQNIWGSAQSPLDRVTFRMVTAPAAAQLPPNGRAAQAPDVIRSLVLAGDWRRATNWWRAVSAAAAEGDGTAKASQAAIWPVMAALDVQRQVAGSAQAFETWFDGFEAADGDAKTRAGQVAVAALRGLGLSYAQGSIAGLPGRVDSYDAASGRPAALLQAAVQGGRQGEAALLAALTLYPSLETVTPGRLEAALRSSPPKR